MDEMTGRFEVASDNNSKEIEFIENVYSLSVKLAVVGSFDRSPSRNLIIFVLPVGSLKSLRSSP